MSSCKNTCDLSIFFVFLLIIRITIKIAFFKKKMVDEKVCLTIHYLCMLSNSKAQHASEVI